MSMSVASDTYRYARRWSDTLVETGTHKGLGLLGATRAGFERMFTCEFSQDLMREAFKNMGDQFGAITYFLGDSGDILPKMLKATGRKSVVLLDAHSMSLDPNECPLQRELDALERDEVRDHLILVDDIDLAGTATLGNLSLEYIQQRLYAINGRYRFGFMGGVRPNMLLAAEPPGYPFPR